MEKKFPNFCVDYFVLLSYVCMQSWESESQDEALNLFYVSCVDESTFSVVKFQMEGILTDFQPGLTLKQL